MMFVDTHIHLLPGIDDGSPNMASTVEFARAVRSAGVTDVLCTPHLRYEDDPSTGAHAVLEATRAALREEGISLNLHLGWEIAFLLVAEMPAKDLERYTLSGGRHVLLEVPHGLWPAYAEEAVHRVRLAGMVPVLAHPERNPVLRRSPDIVERLLSLGAVLQGTTSSYLGLFGTEAREFLIELARDGKLSLLASDAHYDRRATWDLPGATEELTVQLDGLNGELLASGNPRRMIEGEPLVPPEPVAARGRLLGYLKGVFG